MALPEISNVPLLSKLSKLSKLALRTRRRPRRLKDLCLLAFIGPPCRGPTQAPSYPHGPKKNAERIGFALDVLLVNRVLEISKQLLRPSCRGLWSSSAAIPRSFQLKPAVNKPQSRQSSSKALCVAESSASRSFRERRGGTPTEASAVGFNEMDSKSQKGRHEMHAAREVP